MYLGDPRENQICPDEHTIWEEDNRKEQRWKWNAMVVDLCDLDPKEYAQTIFYTKPHPDDKGLIDNQLSVTFGADAVSISFPYEPASDLVMVINDSNGNKEIVSIPKGAESPVTKEIENIDPKDVTSIYIGDTVETAVSPKFEDDTYSYTVSKQPTSSDFVKYVVMNHLSVEQGLTEEKIIAAGVLDAIVSGKDSRFTYILKPVSVPGFNDMTEEEAAAIIKENQVDLLMFTSSKVSKIFLNESDDQTASWSTNYSTIELGGLTYYISKYTDKELVNICDTDYETPEDIDFLYKITLQ